MQDDTTNAGCNNDPVRFSTIQCGSAVCGDAGTYHAEGDLLVRDTDWYALVLEARAIVTWTVQAEFPVIPISIRPATSTPMVLLGFPIWCRW